MEFVLVTACAAHDLHNAFRWSLPFFSDKELLGDIFIGCASLRSSSNVFLTYLAEWVLGVLNFTPPISVEEKATWSQLWSALGVKDEPFHFLVDVLEIRFSSEGWLLVSQAVSGDPNIVGVC